MARGGKQGGKSSPKIGRSGMASTKAKYAEQFKRTARNKARRIKQHNGDEFYKDWLAKQ
jgi:hypothetical protein